MTDFLFYEEIESVNNKFLKMAMNMYSDFLTFHILPHGGGSLCEPNTVIQILKILKDEEVNYNNWEMEKMRNGK